MVEALDALQLLAQKKQATPESVHNLSVLREERSPARHSAESSVNMPTDVLSQPASGKGTTSKKPRKRSSHGGSRADLPLLLVHFNKGRAVEVGGGKLLECALCDATQESSDEKMWFARHCNTKEHRMRLEVASEIVDEVVNASTSLKGLVRDIPKRVRSRIGY
jgi:hypothetical protein